MSESIYLYFIIHILIGLSVFFLAVFVFVKNRNQVNIYFFLFYLFIALWAFFYSAWLLAKTPESALFLSRILNLAAIFIPVLYLSWLLSFLGIYSIRKTFIPYIFTIIFTIFSFNDIFISGVKSISFFPFFPQSGWLHHLFLVQWSVIILISYFLIIKYYFKTKDSHKKKQLIYILTGSLFGFVGGSSNFLLMLDIDSISPFGSLLVIVFPFMIGYAMIKHNLLNTKIVFSQVLLMLMNIFSIATIFVSRSITEYILKSLFAVAMLFTTYLLIKNYGKEQKQKEELFKLSKELKRANAELKRLDKAKSEFISIASHQLRTPLTAIKGYISLILEGAYGKNAPETEEALNKIFLANERLIQLVEDLLNITHIESGQLEYHIEDVHLEEILKELYDMFTMRAQDKGIDFVLDLPDGQLPVLQADKSKLREVISNLIDNAIKYTNKGFVHVSVKYNKRTLRIIVEDSGVGISETSMKTLFAKFSRGTDSSKVYTEGTGLGLFVGRNLIESQGGHIYAKSDGVDKGSTFIIEMPINKDKK